MEGTSEEFPNFDDAIAEHYGKVKLPYIVLDKKEYGHIVHEINTWYRRDYKKKKVISKAIGDYIYTFENKGYNNYGFIGRDNIEEFLDKWEAAKHVKW